jgi:FkbM family methyltransferase
VVTLNRFNPTENNLKVLVINTLRLFNMIWPVRKGKSFIRNIIQILLTQEPIEIQKIIRCKYHLKFIVNYSEPQFYQLISDGIYEYLESEILAKVIKKGDIILDIGANFGWYTIFGASLVGHSGEVHSFEPIPEIYRFLEANVKLSQYHKIIKTNNFGLGDKEAYLKFYKFRNSACGDSSAFLFRGKEVEREYLCKTKLLDDYLSEKVVKKVDFIKCDVEGFELRVLKGSKQLLASNNLPIILIEVNDAACNVAGYESRDILKFLKKISDNRYSFFRVGEGWITEHKLGDPLGKVENILCLVRHSHWDRIMCLNQI